MSIGTDPICQYCGRPVLNDTVWGPSGMPYHATCVEAAPTKSAYTWVSGVPVWLRSEALLGEIADLLRDLKALIKDK